MTTRFDPTTHTYFIDERPVPSVTQIIRRVYGTPSNAATDWHMQRGQAVHACAAMLARGESFTHDPAIDGQVQACRNWFTAFNPIVIETETQLYSTEFRYAGTPDVICRLPTFSHDVVIDWKSSTSGTEYLQLAGYGLLSGENYGATVVLDQDGKFHMSAIMDLRKWQRRFMATLTVYNVMDELGINTTKEARDE